MAGLLLRSGRDWQQNSEGLLMLKNIEPNRKRSKAGSLTAEEFENMLKFASQENQSLD